MKVDRNLVHALVGRELSRKNGNIKDIEAFCSFIISEYIREKQLAYAEFVPVAEEIKAELLARKEEDS